MLCEKCGKFNCQNLQSLTLKTTKNGLPLDDKEVKVCEICWGWFQNTYKDSVNGNVINLVEGKPVGLYKLSLYSWGTKAPRKPKQPETLQEYQEKAEKVAKKEAKAKKEKSVV